MSVAVAILFVLPCAAQNSKLSDWTRLIDKNDAKAAKALCSRFINSQKIAEQVEAQKCLANAALCGNSEMELEGDDAGGGTLRGSYKPAAVDEALVHLNLALKLAPQDVTIHEGRLHVLEVSGRYSDMIKALDESCTIYQGKDAPAVWINYSPELADLRQYNVALEFSKVLDKHYPNSPDILGNIGAFLNMLGKSADAIPYLQHAIALAPNDPINTWDLGRSYDYTDQIALADQWYQKGLILQTDPDQHKESACLYAQFVEKKLHDSERACVMEKKNCANDEQTACVAPVETK